MELLGLLILPLFFMVGLAILAFWIWVLIDCATKEPSEGNDKIVWIIVIVLTGILGAIIYVFARRPGRIAEFGR